MTDSPCVIEWTADEDGNLSVAEFVRQQAQQAPPLLAWAEPDPLGVDLTNHTGRRDGFELLVSGGMPSWPVDLPLAEARLFWTNSALHVVARDGGGCGWAWIEEKPAGNAGTPVARSVIPVHTLRDGKRFGLPDGQTIAGLRAIEYRQQGRLVAWRLTTEEA